MKNPNVFTAFTAFLLGAICLGGCTQTNNRNTDVSIVWIKNHYATLFRVGYSQTDSFIEVFSNDRSQQTLGRFFWGKSSSVPGFEKLQSRQRIVSLSAIHTGMLAELNVHHCLVGVESTKYIAHPVLLNSAFLKTLSEVAPDGPIIPEKLALSQPTLVLGSISSIEDRQTIERLGKNKFSILWCNNYLENHPLGRAEWLIAMGWITGQSTLANTVFSQVRKNYEQLADSAERSTQTSPKVIANCAYNGIWFVPQNQSYIAQFIRDAGGEPISVNIGAGSNAINIEKAITLFRDADIWINTDLCTSLRCLEQSDPRVMHIKAFKNRRVYHFNKQLQANGSNPYWDMGCIYPNRILSDLFHIIGDTHRLESAYYYDICK